MRSRRSLLATHRSRNRILKAGGEPVILIRDIEKLPADILGGVPFCVATDPPRFPARMLGKLGFSGVRTRLHRGLL